jgi:hypothetical protein
MKLDPMAATSQSLLSIGAIVGINRVGCDRLPPQFRPRRNFRPVTRMRCRTGSRDWRNIMKRYRCVSIFGSVCSLQASPDFTPRSTPCLASDKRFSDRLSQPPSPALPWRLPRPQCMVSDLYTLLDWAGAWLGPWWVLRRCPSWLRRRHCRPSHRMDLKRLLTAAHRQPMRRRLRTTPRPGLTMRRLPPTIRGRPCIIRSRVPTIRRRASPMRRARITRLAPATMAPAAAVFRMARVDMLTGIARN